MSSCILICSSLGTSALWEVHKEGFTISEICKVFLGWALGVDLGHFQVDFGTILGAVGNPKSGKGE